MSTIIGCLVIFCFCVGFGVGRFTKWGVPKDEKEAEKRDGRIKPRHAFVWGFIWIAFIWAGGRNLISAGSGLVIASWFIWFMRKEINEASFRKWKREKKTD